MKVVDAIKVLTDFNKWRRGEPPYDWNEDPSLMIEFPFDVKEVGEAIDEAINMLKHVDMMEREESREKKYEYGVIPHGVYFVYQTLAEAEHKQSVLEQAHFHYPIVRREVGEWEEVKG